MEFRSLDITVISAEDLKNVSLFCRMAVYAVVSVEKTKCKTHADREGGRNPRWSHRLKFSVDTAAAARNPNLVLIFKLRSENFFFGHRDVGNVVIPVANLLAPIAMAPSSSFSPTNSEQVVDYQVRTPAGKPKGTLKFAYKFGDKPKTGGSAPLPTPPPNATAPPSCFSIPPPYNVLPPPPQPLPQPLYPLVYPQHHSLLGYGYPLPQPPMPQGYGPGPGPGPSYGYMPPPGYGGYGLERPQESRCGGGGSLMGAGAGLGLVGGMLIGGMMSEVGEMTAEAVEMAVAAGEMASCAGYETVDAVFDI